MRRRASRQGSWFPAPCSTARIASMHGSPRAAWAPSIRDQSRDRRCGAIKALRAEYFGDPKLTELFRREGSVLRKLRHPAVVYYEGIFFDKSGQLYLVMELVEGSSLATVADGRPLPVDAVRRLRERLAGGLAAAHEAGIVHRDISPDNVILPGGRVEDAKLIDFGIARQLVTAQTTLIGDGFAGKLTMRRPSSSASTAGRSTDARTSTAWGWSSPSPRRAVHRTWATRRRARSRRARRFPILRRCRRSCAARSRACSLPIRRYAPARPEHRSAPPRPPPRCRARSRRADASKRRSPPAYSAWQRLRVPVPVARAARIRERARAGGRRRTRCAGTRAGARTHVCPHARARAGGSTRAGTATPGRGVAASRAAITAATPAGTRFRDCSGCPEMIVIPGGRFTMGTPDREAGRSASEGPQTPMSIPPFALSVQPVTRGEWQVCATESRCPPHTVTGAGTLPVGNVTLRAVQDYLAWLAAAPASPIACRRRRNGNMPRAPEPPPRIGGATRSAAATPIAPAAAAPGTIARRRRSAASGRTHRPPRHARQHVPVGGGLRPSRRLRAAPDRRARLGFGRRRRLQPHDHARRRLEFAAAGDPRRCSCIQRIEHSAALRRLPRGAVAAALAGDQRPRSRRPALRRAAPRAAVLRCRSQSRLTTRAALTRAAEWAERTAHGSDPRHRAHRFPRQRQDHPAQRLLKHPAMNDAAVHHQRVRRRRPRPPARREVDDDIVLMQSGCLCCTIRSDLIETLRDCS